MQTAKLVTERIWGLESKKNHHPHSKESYGDSLNPMTSSGQPGFRVAQPLQRHGYPRTEPVGKGGRQCFLDFVWDTPLPIQKKTQMDTLSQKI